MCNLYRLADGAAEIARLFAALNGTGGANMAEEVYPGTPGLVVAEGIVRPMAWGFPLAQKGAKGQPLKPKPVNNTRTDKLDSAFWRASFRERRCLIPLTDWAEADGPEGAKRRSWFRVPDAPVTAAAGVWRHSSEWGLCYSMVMTDAAGIAAELHTRMPVLLAQNDWRVWTEGEPEAARALCRPWEGPLELERTNILWNGRPAPPVQPSLL